MKMFKTLLWAIVAIVSLAVCATSAKAGIGIVTNYSKVTFSATIITNGYYPKVIPGGYKSLIGPQKCVTKDLINMLTNMDFANSSFPAGSQLVVGWDQGWNGDVLVVDNTGTNVIYDATYNNGNSNNATFYINFFNRRGAASYTEIRINGGTDTCTGHDVGYFQLSDYSDGIYIDGTGPCTEHFTDKGFTSTNAPAWSDSEVFTTYGWSEDSRDYSTPLIGTVTGKLTASGHGRGYPTHLPQP